MPPGISHGRTHQSPAQKKPVLPLLFQAASLFFLCLIFIFPLAYSQTSALNISFTAPQESSRCSLNSSQYLTIVNSLELQVKQKIGVYFIAVFLQAAIFWVVFFHKKSKDHQPLTGWVLVPLTASHIVIFFWTLYLVFLVY